MSVHSRNVYTRMAAIAVDGRELVDSHELYWVVIRLEIYGIFIEIFGERETEKQDLEKELEKYRNKVFLYQSCELRKIVSSRAKGRIAISFASSTAADHGTVSVSERIEQELARQVVDDKESKVTFDEFPCYLSEQTRVVLTSAAYVHLKQADFYKYTRNLSPVSRAILFSGPAELNQQMIAKALAHYFETKLLLLDVTDFFT